MFMEFLLLLSLVGVHAHPAHHLPMAGDWPVFGLACFLAGLAVAVLLGLILKACSRGCINCSPPALRRIFGLAAPEDGHAAADSPGGDEEQAAVGADP